MPTSGAQLPSSKVDMPPVDKTALAVNSTTVLPRERSGGNQFVEGAQEMANQGIGAKTRCSKQCDYYIG
ncbi:hypothetical protein FD724_06735 [Nostoc sp. C057]|uniref:hypothetical protein n=1 Tax=Nostoc sp. C057 TaxID=2576903 RepID=UPI0015C35006|nr:hypothetical protein [Nostoc sp. C057]QLE47835.1 hypothetical protein FD724_06735 [Nostoc sp. C057]